MNLIVLYTQRLFTISRKNQSTRFFFLFFYYCNVDKPVRFFFLNLISVHINFYLFNELRQWTCPLDSRNEVTMKLKKRLEREPWPPRLSPLFFFSQFFCSMCIVSVSSDRDYFSGSTGQRAGFLGGLGHGELRRFTKKGNKRLKRERIRDFWLDQNFRVEKLPSDFFFIFHIFDNYAYIFFCH